jgi:phytoene/squalene synthetase
MVDDSKTSNSVQRSKRVSDLLDGMKRYLRIEHHDDDKELLEYLRNQAGLHRE